MFKKNTLALAIAAITLAPVSAIADEVYGFINIGLESTSIDGAGAANEIFASGPDGSLHAQDVAESRIGYKGSKDLGSGMNAAFKIELGLGTTPGAGGPTEDTTPTTRLAQIALSGDFGTITAGNQWGILYEYLGWNVFRAHGHGAGTWYYTTKNINDDAFGLRVSNAFTYTYGGGGYSADGLTFSVQAIADDDTAAVAGSPAVTVPDGNGGTVTITEAVSPKMANDEAIDALVIAAAFTSGELTLNAVFYNESDSSGSAEPSLTGLGARYNLSAATYIGGNYMMVDNDAGGDISSINVLLTHDLGEGISGMVSFGNGDGDNAIADLDSNLFLQLQKDYGQGVITYIEYETAKLEGGAKTSVIAAALKYSF